MRMIIPLEFFNAIIHGQLPAGQLPAGHHLMVWSKIRRSGKPMTDWCVSAQNTARRIAMYGASASG